LYRPRMAKPRARNVRRTDSFPYSSVTYKKAHKLWEIAA
jgi:hypothetical protein